MMSPIGQFLTEFRPADTPAFVPMPSQDAATDFAADLSFDADDDGLLLLTDQSASDDVPFEMDAAVEEAPDSPAEVPSEAASEAALDALKADHAAELTQARLSWAESEGVALAARITQSFDDLERKLADTLAPLLEPFLAKAAQLKALDQLRGAIGTLLTGGDQPPVTVRGPEDLLEAIKRSYPGQPAIAFQVTDEPDVTITMGDTRIRSQLRSWARKLDAALGAQR